MRVYFIYSFFLHSAIILLVAFVFLRPQRFPVNYYNIDFLGNLPAGGSSGQPNITIKEAVVKEDKVGRASSELLIPDKKKMKNKKIVKSTRTETVTSGKRGISGSENSQNNKKGGGKGGSEGNEGVGGTGSGVGGIYTTGDFPYVWYLNRIKQRLLSNWNPPGYYQDQIAVQVKFIVQRNGRITNVEVEKTSGDSFFDQSGLRTVFYSDPLPPLPSEYPENQLGIHVKFVGRIQ